MLAIRNARILTPQGEIDRGTIMMSDGRIDAIGALDAVAIPETAEVIEAGGLTAVPGLIDLQFNGGFGLDFTADPTTIWDVAAQLPQHGVTTFLPTIITSPLATVARAQAVLRDGPPPEFVGARPLGLHIEGPFLNVGKKGAHNPAHLRPPTVEAAADWSPETGRAPGHAGPGAAWRAGCGKVAGRSRRAGQRRAFFGDLRTGTGRV